MRVISDVSCMRNRRKDLGQPRCTTYGFIVVVGDQTFPQQQHIDLFARTMHLHDVAKKRAMSFIMKIFRAQQVNDFIATFR